MDKKSTFRKHINVCKESNARTKSTINKVQSMAETTITTESITNLEKKTAKASSSTCYGGYDISTNNKLAGSIHHAIGTGAKGL